MAFLLGAVVLAIPMIRTSRLKLVGDTVMMHRSASFFVVTPSQVQLGQLADLVDEGAIRPLIAATYPLADGPTAYATRGTGRPGKTVLPVE